MVGPGDPPATATTPPNGYVPTNPQNRTDWNGFLDFLNKQKDVNTQQDPNAVNTMMGEYKKQNPNFSITPAMLPAIQYEQQQFRKGATFSGLNPDQLNMARTGMSPNFINQTDPYKSYYPQFKVGGQDFGTDVEGYAKFKAGDAQPASASPTQPVQQQAVAQPASQPAGAIPLPNYDDPKSRIRYLQTAKQKYGNILQGRGDALIHVNETPEGGVDTAKDSATKAATKLGLDPALLYTSAMEEGMSGMFAGKDGKVDASDSDKYPVDGFHNYGLDNFHDQFKTLVAKGYLPKDFDYEKSVNTNENGQKVNSANFKTPDDAMQAKAAYVKMEQDDIENYAKKNNIQLSDKAKQFFTLVNFNGGEGTGHRMIDYYNKKGLLQGDKFLTVAPEEGLRLAPSWKNVTPRMKMADILKKEGLF